jgi:hypothetical protein
MKSKEVPPFNDPLIEMKGEYELISNIITITGISQGEQLYIIYHM